MAALNAVNKWYSHQDPQCFLCNEHDTIEHYFYHCDHVRTFWNSFNIWWNNVSNIDLHLTAMEVLFGIPNENGDNLVYVLNFCIMQAKHIIHRYRLKSKNIDFQDFINKLRIRLESEKLIYALNNKNDVFNEKWHDILNDL